MLKSSWLRAQMQLALHYFFISYLIGYIEMTQQLIRIFENTIPSRHLLKFEINPWITTWHSSILPNELQSTDPSISSIHLLKMIEHLWKLPCTTFFLKINQKIWQVTNSRYNGHGSCKNTTFTPNFYEKSIENTRPRFHEKCMNFHQNIVIFNFRLQTFTN